MLSEAQRLPSEKGATAIVVAAALSVLIGFAAIAIDIGAGFNERRQDQTAADMSALAGAVGYTIGDSVQDVVQAALDTAEANLTRSYSVAEWQSLWTSCTDPDRITLTLPDGTTQSLLPLPAPWGAGDLECVSSGSSYFRIRIPNQETATTFARIFGASTLETWASAVAKIEPAENQSPLLPLGVPGGTANGEICLSSASTGTASDPCDGSTAGAFGEIRSEFFGDFFGSASCSNPGATELRQNVALGIDHFIAIWSGDTDGDGSTDQTVGSLHPGDVAVTGFDSIARDACVLSGGAVAPQYPGEVLPANTMLVDTGTSSTIDVQIGLISDTTFLGNPSRLRQGGGLATRDIVMFRNFPGTNETIYANIDNTGPWSYLSGTGNCSPGGYTSSMNTQEKVDQFTACISNYSGSADIFTASIASSPRFAWAPEYWFEASTSGLSWQPVHEYRMVYIGALGFNCSAPGCEAVFYPDADESDEVCAVSGSGGCSSLTLDQMSAWLLPNEAVPDSVRSLIPGGGQTPFVTTLIR